jgi:alpha-ribazole phosphatase
MRLYLIRHGKPDTGPGFCYGSSDIAVPPQEHARVAAILLPMLPVHAPVFSSPLRRCAELAAQLAASLQSGGVVHDQRLAEMHFGEWEMRAWEEIPRMQVDAWANDTAGYRPGGGESVEDVARRVRAFHDELLSQNRESVIVVCHAGTMRLLMQCQAGISAMEMARNAARGGHTIAYGELIIFDC